MKCKIKKFLFLILVIAQTTRVYALTEPNESSSQKVSSDSSLESLSQNSSLSKVSSSSSSSSQSPNLKQSSPNNKDFKTASNKELGNSSSSKKDNLLPPKAKVDDSEELDCNDLKLSIDSSSPDDFGFIQSTKHNFENNIEWMKILGIVFILLACTGFTYVLFGLLALRKFYLNKKK